MNKPRFRLLLTKEADDFMQSLPLKARDKMYYNIRRVQMGDLDSEIFKKFENSDIWEFRTLFGGIAYRLFAFWDTETDTLVIATHGLVKKTQKTPAKEINKAERIRKEYFDLKRNEQ